MTAVSFLMKIHRLQFSIVFLILSNLLVFQIAFLQGQQWKSVASSSTTIAETATFAERQINPVYDANPLPSIRVVDPSRETIYGGQGDKPHLGGFVDVDMHGLSPATWTFMVETIGVKSVIDIGCGRGISTSWFVLHGVEALCVEGSHDALEKTMLPDPSTQMVEHDFSRGPWWPAKTYDAVWCVEFLEHVGRNFHKNYLPTFRKAAFIFVTHSTWGGWHHVEVHDEEWWITRFEMYGFKYSERLTKKVKYIAQSEKSMSSSIQGAKDGKYNSQHVWLHMMVFINPEVAGLPQHAHLMAEQGCFKATIKDKEGNRISVNRECGTGRNNAEESKLPEEFKPIWIDEPEKKRKEWEEWVNKHINLQNKTA